MLACLRQTGNQKIRSLGETTSVATFKGRRKWRRLKMRKENGCLRSCYGALSALRAQRQRGSPPCSRVSRDSWAFGEKGPHKCCRCRPRPCPWPLRWKGP